MKEIKSKFMRKLKERHKTCILFLLLAILILLLLIVLITVTIVELLLLNNSYATTNFTSATTKYTTLVITTPENNLVTTTTINTSAEFEEFEKFCGISNYESSYRLNKRIINGQDAIKHSFPWLVSLYELKDGIFSSHFCAGTLISTQLVLTAAHVTLRFIISKRKEKSEMSDSQYENYLSEMKSKRIAVAVGIHEHDRTNLADHIYIVDKITFHEDFSMAPCCQDDISILKLEKSVEIDKKVNFICLPFFLNNLKKRIKDLNHNDQVAVVGWGLTDFSNEHSYSLKQTVLRVENDEKICDVSKYWKSHAVYCLIGDIKNSTICYKDSGGPIMYYYQKRWYIMGIISHFSVDHNKIKNIFFSHECSHENPSFSVKLDLYAEWIKNYLYEL